MGSTVQRIWAPSVLLCSSSATGGTMGQGPAAGTRNGKGGGVMPCFLFPVPMKKTDVWESMKLSLVDFINRIPTVASLQGVDLKPLQTLLYTFSTAFRVCVQLCANRSRAPWTWLVYTNLKQKRKTTMHSTGFELYSQTVDINPNLWFVRRQKHQHIFIENNNKLMSQKSLLLLVSCTKRQTAHHLFENGQTAHH